jgi:hypothetical protein
MRLFLIEVLSKIGSWACQSAIKLADRGHIDFEVIIPDKPKITFKHKKKTKKRGNLMIALIFVISMILAIWSVIAISSAIERSSIRITEELRAERHQEMEINRRNFQNIDYPF